MPGILCPKCRKRIKGNRCPICSASRDHKSYDKLSRNQEAKKFYNSARWKKARALALAKEPFCRRCGQNDGRAVKATVVDHIQPLQLRPDLATSLDNLRCLCGSCHNAVRKEQRQRF